MSEEHPDTGFFRRIAKRGMKVLDKTPPRVLLVCMSESEGPPAVPSEYGACECGEAIYWSFRSPADAKRVCKRCAAIEVAKAQAAGTFAGINTTREMDEEARDYLKKNP